MNNQQGDGMTASEIAIKLEKERQAKLREAGVPPHVFPKAKRKGGWRTRMALQRSANRRD